MVEDCGDVKHLLEPFAEGDLPEDRASIVRNHLLECPGCRLDLERTCKVAEFLGSLPDIRCPEEVLLGIDLATCGGKGAGRPSGRFRFIGSLLNRRTLAVGAAAAAAALVLLLYPIVKHGYRPGLGYSEQEVSVARAEARWTLTYAAGLIGKEGRGAVNGVLGEELPRILKKSLSSSTQITQRSRR